MTFPKNLIAALAIGALALPAMTVSLFTLSATPAFAKNNNKGGGSRGGNSSRGRSGSHKPAQTRSQRGGNGNGAANGNRGNGRPTQQVAVTTAPVAAETSELAPNQLGSMNGAMHANINAVLAHIRNGNTNGPVGALAALAMADAGVDDAQTVLDAAEIYAGLESDLELAVTNVEGYETLEDYLAAKELGGEEFELDQAIEDALAALEAAQEPPTEEQIASATEALGAQQAAEDGIFAAWNKSGDATEEEQAALLQALRDRLEAESGAIAETIDSLELADAAIEETEGEEPVVE